MTHLLVVTPRLRRLVDAKLWMAWRITLRSSLTLTDLYRTRAGSYCSSRTTVGRGLCAWTCACACVRRCMCMRVGMGRHSSPLNTTQHKITPLSKPEPLRHNGAYLFCISSRSLLLESRPSSLMASKRGVPGQCLAQTSLASSFVRDAGACSVCSGWWGWRGVGGGGAGAYAGVVRLVLLVWSSW